MNVKDKGFIIFLPIDNIGDYKKMSQTINKIMPNKFPKMMSTQFIIKHHVLYLTY